MLPYAVAGAQRDGNFRVGDDTSRICATLAGPMIDESGSPLLWTGSHATQWRAPTQDGIVCGEPEGVNTSLDAKLT
jgi:hypothetical protein